MMTILEHILDNITAELTRRGWHRRDLARRTGISEGMLSEMFNGRIKGNIRYEFIYKIAKVLGMTTEELTGFPPLYEDKLRAARKELEGQNIDGLIKGLKALNYPDNVIRFVELLSEMSEDQINSLITLLQKS